MFSEAYHPSIFYRTPQEHLECQWRKDIQLPPALPERFVDVLDLQVIAQRPRPQTRPRLRVSRMARRTRRQGANPQHVISESRRAI